jgi:MinD superfamily P-loop ATPase
MILGVASGKGGTGKTTVAVGLAAALAAHGGATLVDLDVEAPNAHLFFDLEPGGQVSEYIPVPLVDEEVCTRCGQCSDLCQFKAIAVLGQVIVVYDAMCHGCGGCWTICPEGAISQGQRELGQVSWGAARDVPGLDLIMGSLRVGEAMSPPLMKRVMERVDSQGPIIIDAPPGTSCPVMTAAGFCDAILLVTEPTPFGLYDLSLAVAALRPLGKPLGVVVNRAGLGDEKVFDYCQKEGLPVLAEIPFDRKVAQAYSQGRRMTSLRPNWERMLLDIYTHFLGELGLDEGRTPVAEVGR